MELCPPVARGLAGPNQPSSPRPPPAHSSPSVARVLAGPSQPNALRPPPAHSSPSTSAKREAKVPRLQMGNAVIAPPAPAAYPPAPVAPPARAPAPVAPPVTAPPDAVAPPARAPVAPPVRDPAPVAPPARAPAPVAPPARDPAPAALPPENRAPPVAQPAPGPAAPPIDEDPVPEEEFDLDRVPNKNVYYRLIEMFPNKNFNAIRRLMIYPPFFTGNATDDVLVTRFIDFCCDDTVVPDRHNPPAAVNRQNMNAEEYVEMLKNILPNADPSYLKNFVLLNIRTPEKIDSFIEQNLASPRYPTKEEFLKKERLKKLNDEMLNHFDIKKFLETFADPFAHFTDEKRTCYYKEAVIDYLKAKYRTIRMEDIRQTYRNQRYNLTLTAEHLDSLKNTMKRTRRDEIPTLEESILFEVAFLKHKNEIKNYLTELKETEERESKECQEKGSFVQCQCCFEEFIPSKTVSCKNAHSFCKPCLAESIRVKMAENVYSLNCIANCPSGYTIKDLESALSCKTFKTFLKKQQEVEVMAANIEGLDSCPFCGFSMSIPDGVIIFSCSNPSCLKESCRKCKLLNHLPNPCKTEDVLEKARLMVEERMTQALLRSCINCKIPLFKDDGCNKISCPNCKSLMCYLCNRPIKDYTHFRSQGSDNFELCPLYTDDANYNAKFVQEVAKETKREIESKNPNVEIDIEKLLANISFTSVSKKNSAIYASILSAGDKFEEYARIRKAAVSTE